MFLVIPAIDIKEGKCVRLFQGKKDMVTTYFSDPVEVARVWEEKGAARIHIVDLDGAFQGKIANEPVIRKIVETVAIPIQLGGGLRSLEAMARVLKLGVDRVILGTAAWHNPDLVEKAVLTFGSSVMVSIDCREGMVAVAGWEEETRIPALKMARTVKKLGVSRVVVTDTSRDGTMEGINLDLPRQVALETGLRVIISGGASSLKDIQRASTLKDIGIEGIILGRSLYDQAVKLEEAIKIVSS